MNALDEGRALEQKAIKPVRDSKCLTFTFFLRIMGCIIDLSLSIFSCGMRIIIKKRYRSQTPNIEEQ
jgi:hypothetical protein